MLQPDQNLARRSVMWHVIALNLALTGRVAVAIERAVQERMGNVRVAVIELTRTGERCDSVTVAECEPLVALPEPGSRLGRPIRFILAVGDTRVGSVVAKLTVTGTAVRSSHAVAHRENIDADAIELVEAELEGMLLERLPTMAEIVGAPARRALGAGEILTTSTVVVPPVVKSGDKVKVSLSTGATQVTGVGRASDSGQVGDLIRVAVPSSRRGLEARITGPGSVEVVR
jgi:flagella basal body P-ring formation protein FlgA